MHVKGENIRPPLTLITALYQTTETIPPINPWSPLPQRGITATPQTPSPAGPPRPVPIAPAAPGSAAPQRCRAVPGQPSPESSHLSFCHLRLSPRSPVRGRRRAEAAPPAPAARSPAPRREERGGPGEGIPSARALPFLPGEGAGICTSPEVSSNLPAESQSPAFPSLQGQARV